MPVQVDIIYIWIAESKYPCQSKTNSLNMMHNAMSIIETQHTYSIHFTENSTAYILQIVILILYQFVIFIFSVAKFRSNAK